MNTKISYQYFLDTFWDQDVILDFLGYWEIGSPKILEIFGSNYELSGASVVRLTGLLFKINFVYISFPGLSISLPGWFGFNSVP